MKVCLDTSSLIRFFTRDEPKKALAVKKLLEKETEVFIPEVVFPEIEYVLRRVYKVKRGKLIAIFRFLISRSNIKLKPVVKEAVKIFENTNLDMADCLIAAHSLSGKLASFDKQLLLAVKSKSYF